MELKEYNLYQIGLMQKGINLFDTVKLEKGDKKICEIISYYNNCSYDVFDFHIKLLIRYIYSHKITKERSEK